MSATAASLRDHALHLLDLLTLFLCITTEVYILMKRCAPTYHFLPLSFILLFPATLRRLFFGGTDNNVYIVDFSCLRPQPRYRVSKASVLEYFALTNCYDHDTIAFMAKVISSSGVGEETYFPPPLHYHPPLNQFHDFVAEAEYLLFPVLADLLAKTGLAPTDIDILVVNCSIFCPAPSLTSMVVNRFSMRPDVRTFNISGMGCSASGVGVDIARGVLRGRPEALYAVVLSTEILSSSWYKGSDKRKLLVNCQFRSGCSAVLLTNRRGVRSGTGVHRGTPKYRLAHLVRTHRAYDDRSYFCSMQKEDEKGLTGFSVDGDVLHAVTGAVQSNVAAIGGFILPTSEKLRYGAAWLWRFINKRGAHSVPPALDFGLAVQHFCMPSTGRRFIEKMGKGLGLGKRGTEAARMTLQRFGNQSSASVWYQLAYTEAKGRVKVGDKVWMLMLGSGFKCNSVVWECMREVVREAVNGPWATCIHRYPTLDEDKEDVASTVGL